MFLPEFEQSNEWVASTELAILFAECEVGLRIVRMGKDRGFKLLQDGQWMGRKRFQTNKLKRNRRYRKLIQTVDTTSIRTHVMRCLSQRCDHITGRWPSGSSRWLCSLLMLSITRSRWQLWYYGRGMRVKRKHSKNKIGTTRNDRREQQGRSRGDRISVYCFLLFFFVRVYISVDYRTCIPLSVIIWYAWRNENERRILIERSMEQTCNDEWSERQIASRSTMARVEMSLK